MSVLSSVAPDSFRADGRPLSFFRSEVDCGSSAFFDSKPIWVREPGEKSKARGQAIAAGRQIFAVDPRGSPKTGQSGSPENRPVADQHPGQDCFTLL